jgi:hypothetical protein
VRDYALNSEDCFFKCARVSSIYDKAPTSWLVESGDGKSTTRILILKKLKLSAFPDIIANKTTFARLTSWRVLAFSVLFLIMFSSDWPDYNVSPYRNG